ncbi:hypothetical protein SESBI_06000 [Sesbania bispinosa]|nr:hypothetical protein SESBI_06000 [Sesbania bispinosa]
MEAQPAKRRRVYSLEPNKIVMQSIFARNYLNYLVPALMKIKAKSSAEDNSRHCDIKNVKYEVDMAMVFSAQGFAWSNGLKVKLERDHGNVATSTTSFLASHEGSSRIYDHQNEVVTQDYFSSNPRTKSQSDILKKDLAREDNEDEDKMKSLRMLIPGGEEMCDEQMVAELESYIRCLQMQVNVLQCLLAEP